MALVSLPLAVSSHHPSADLFYNKPLSPWEKTPKAITPPSSLTLRRLPKSHLVYKLWKKVQFIEQEITYLPLPTYLCTSKPTYLHFPLPLVPPPSLSITHSISPSIALTQTFFHSLTITHLLALSCPFIYPLTYSLYPSLTKHTQSFTLSYTNPLYHSFYIFYSLSFTHYHSLSLYCIISLTLSFTLPITPQSLSPSPTHALFHCLSLTYSITYCFLPNQSLLTHSPSSSQSLTHFLFIFLIMALPNL
jgi:hypothetical protein